MRQPLKKTYLGDGVYAEYDGYQVRVFTSDGLCDTNEIFFEVDNAYALYNWLGKVYDWGQPK